MKLAVLLLCHEAPAALAPLLESPFFAHAELKLYVHYDARRTEAEMQALRQAVPAGVQCSFVAERVACGWGDYSLVEATHRLLRLALADEAFAFDYAALVSGSCVPIRPWASLREFLRRRQGIDFIQAVDISRRKWVKGGLEHERYQFYFPLNFRSHRAWFDRLTGWQRRLRVRREVPPGLRIHFGSQWFCLTRDTAGAVSQRLADPALRRFFARSWIPDEFAIQSLVAQIQKPERVAGHTLTYYEFDDQGRPLVLDNGHFEHLMRQPFFFARKLSPHAHDLRRRIAAHLGEAELDLSYFERAGEPSSEFVRFQVRALTLPAARSLVGSSRDAWRGVMEKSQRPYYVLHGASRAYLRELMHRARTASPGLPAFDFLFDPLHLAPAAEAPAWLGFQSGMRPRRDHDPASFLHEAVHADPQRPAAFCLDAATPGWVRDYVLWDPNATALWCEPAGLGKYQRAEGALRDIGIHDEAALFESTLKAAPAPQWLPQDFFEQASREGKHGCRIARMAQLPADPADETLRVLREVWAGMPAGDYFLPSEDEARARLLRPRAPGSMA